MARDKNINLKQDILNLAEKMFREYGYEGTTFQKIADELGITKGAITYHFKNKHLIMAHFFDVFFQSLRDFIDLFPEEYRNMYWRYATMYIYVYRQVLKTPHNQELFYHRDQMSMWQSGKVDTIYNIYRRIGEDFHKSFTHEELLMNSYIDLGARIRMYNEYVDNPQLLTVDSFCYYHVYLLGCLSKLDEFTIKENIQHAFDFANRHTPPTSSTLLFE